MKHVPELAVLAAHEIDVVSGGWCGNEVIRFRFPPPPPPVDPYQLLTSPVANQLSAGNAASGVKAGGLTIVG